MIFPRIKKIAIENNWHFGKNSVFGLYNNYYFQMKDGQGFKQISTYLFGVDYEKQDSIRRELIQKKNELRFQNIILKDNILSIIYKETFFSTKKRILNKGLDIVSEVLKSNSIREMDKCFQCNNSVDLNYFYNTANELTRLICKNCFDKEENEKFQNDKAQIYYEQSYAKGLLGAFLFTIVGIVAWVAIAVYLHLLTTFGAIMLGLLSFNGYKYFKGSMNKTAKWLLFSLIIFSILLANYISVGLEIYINNPGILLEVILYNLFHNKDIIAVLIKNISISLLLSIIPFIYIFKYFNNNMGISKWVLAQKVKT